MALIICTECGKEFSDKAPACPNCGCPNIPPHEENKEKTKLVFKPGLVQPIYGMRIDKKHRTFACGFLDDIHSFDDIIDVDIFENGNSVTKTSTASVVGRTALGAVINPVGAIIGGVTAKKKSIEIINSMEVHITVKSDKKPLLIIKIDIPKKTKKDSKDYQKALTKAKNTVAAIQNLKLS